MKRIFSFSFVFFLFLGLFSFNSTEVQAAITDVTTARSFANANDLNNYAVITFQDSQTYIVVNPIKSATYLHGSSYYLYNGTTFLTQNAPDGLQWSWGIDIHYSTVDIMNPDGTVFFSETLGEIPKALKEVVPNLGAQALKILPVAIAILAAMMGVSLISRVLYRYL